MQHEPVALKERGSSESAASESDGGGDAPVRDSAPNLFKPAARGSKRRPQARLRGLVDDELAVADWASLFGDLARRPSIAPQDDPPVEWRVHDRTHVEFAIDYPLGEGPVTHTWEA